ncbi:MAG: hypothetical protein EAZ21_07975 [Betaproteobacteria bacterium]|nr:MAG: hypothetical protein EAZ21_07975 [Betaproteobacteria bacterium]
MTTKPSTVSLANWPLTELNLFHSSPWEALLERQKLLTWFALVMLVCAIVASVIAIFDERLIRGANLWFKPIKFMISTAAFALTTAWFMGMLEPAQRQTAIMQGLVWVLILTALFEVIYITGAAALGGESHHNISTPFKAAMFGLMAVAAVALTATQGVLAWAIWRNAPVSPIPVAAQAVIIGLMLTWLLGTASGFLLGGKQPPAFSPGALPIIGWHLSGSDGRPAHFLGLHAHQLLPVLGFVLQRYAPHALGSALLWISSAAYVGAWWWATRLALR